MDKDQGIVFGGLMTEMSHVPADFVADYCALPKPKGSKLAPED